MTKPYIFFSYSHKDEEWKDRLLGHFRVSVQQGLFMTWEDRMIGLGDDWLKKIQEAMDSASIAILLVSANSLTSEFILREEVEHMLRRRDKEGLHILPVIIKPCDWEAVSWLRQMNLYPRDGRPISGGSEYQIDVDCKELAKEVRRLLDQTDPGPAPPVTTPLAPEKISIRRLPITGRNLFGRDRELGLLDEAWADRSVNIFTLVALGGVGKSSLVNHWLRRLAHRNYGGAGRVYAWSFYSQGTEDQAVSADLFVDSALRWFGDPNPALGSPRDKGERLVELIRAQRTLLVLDGLEPLQYPPGKHEGRLKDSTLRVLLRALASRNPGLCVISTRLAVSDLDNFMGQEAKLLELEPLPVWAGAQLLKAQGVRGDEAELEKAVEEFKGHSLALTLLGSYLRDVYGGDIRRRGEIFQLEEDMRYGDHARRVMSFYERWFGEGPEVSVLRMLGLFKRLADGKAIAALRARPVIPGLTDHLHGLDEGEWRQVLIKLRSAKLLAEQDPEEPDTLDAHPLIREHFGQQLKVERPEAWREGNYRLYQHLKHAAPKYPETIREMAPLYAAVSHGCEAGRHQESLDEVYRERVLRGSEFFSTSQFGAFSAELATLASFFRRLWNQPVPELDDASKAFVLHEAGFGLRALGRLAEAAQPMRASLGAYVSREDWKVASVNAGQLSHVYLVIGELQKALEYAHLCVVLADLSQDNFWRPRQRATLAKTLHHFGRFAEAESTFREAEEMQKMLEPRRPQLYALWGHYYCDFLLSRGQYREVRLRALNSLKWGRSGTSLVMVATDHLSTGWACLFQAQQGDTRQLRRADRHLTKAVDKLRQAGRLDHLPRGLLARAELRALQNDFQKAFNNLDEARSIAQSGNMKLHEADCYLQYAKFYLRQGERQKARESLDKATEMVRQMGYHRRDQDIEYLREQLGHP